MAAINGCRWWRPLLSVGLPLRVYIYEKGRLLLVTTFSDALRTAYPRPTFCEHKQCGKAGIRNRRPQRDTCTGVRTIRFLGSVLATARFAARPSLIKFQRHSSAYSRTIKMVLRRKERLKGTAPGYHRFALRCLLPLPVDSSCK
jgi:hypothetical protein